MSEFIIDWDENLVIDTFSKNSLRGEIVRCRDCVWFTPEYEYQEEREYGVFETMVEPSDCGNPERCSHHYDSITGKVVPVHIATDPDGFCAWGARKE